jgi:hypothetical protein
MRKLGYVNQNGDIVWTLKDRKTCESCGDTFTTKLFTIPEERTIPIVAYKAVNGKLVRQTV